MVVLETITIRIVAESLFVLEHSFVLRVELCLGLKIKFMPYVFTGFFFFKCYYLFDWFVDLSVTYLEL